MILRQLTARVTKHGKDPYGRFTWHELLLDGTRNLVVVTAYRVSQRRPKGCGPTTSIMQQWRQLRKKGIDSPNPQKQMLDDLAIFLQPHLQAGNEAIIMMDANDTINSRPMDDFMESLDLCDLMTDFLLHIPPTTYHRGSKKIDHIIGTQGILFATRRAYILPFGSDSPKSDHAICGIDVSLDLLCGMQAASTHDTTHPSTRNLWSTDVKASEKYVEMAMQMFDTNNIANRTKILLDRCTRTGKCTANDERALNAINANITRILLTAESKCKQAHGHDWSPLLANAGRTVIAAKWHLSDIMQGRSAIPPSMTRESAILLARSQINAAYDVLRNVQQNASAIRETFLED
jgi:hypothetical protein